MTGKRLRSEAGCEGPVHAADLFGTFFPGSFGNCQGSCCDFNLKCPSWAQFKHLFPSSWHCFVGLQSYSEMGHAWWR